MERWALNLSRLCWARHVGQQDENEPSVAPNKAMICGDEQDEEQEAHS